MAQAQDIRVLILYSLLLLNSKIEPVLSPNNREDGQCIDVGQFHALFTHPSAAAPGWKKGGPTLFVGGLFGRPFFYNAVHLITLLSRRVCFFCKKQKRDDMCIQYG